MEWYLIEDYKTALTMFENGEVDLLTGTIPTEDIPRLKKEGKLKTYPGLSTYF